MFFKCILRFLWYLNLIWFTSKKKTKTLDLIEANK